MDQGATAVTGSTFLNEAMFRLAPAYSGSCALVSYYHSESQLLKVACTGDSRAVLGRRDAAGEWEAIALSTDQVGGLIFTWRNPILTLVQRQVTIRMKSLDSSKNTLVNTSL